MNIADIASEVGTVYDRTLHTSLTLPFSGFEAIAIAQNDVVTSTVINNAIGKLYDNYIQLYRYSNVASNVIPISSIGFIGALPSDPPEYITDTAIITLTSFVITPVYTVKPSSRTEIHTVTSYKTATQNLTSFGLSSTTTNFENLFYYSGKLDDTKYWLPDQDAYIIPGYTDANQSFYIDFGQPSKNKAVLAKDVASPFNDKETVYKIIESTNVENHGIGQAVTNGVLDIGNTYTFSIYAKAAERTLLWAAGGGSGYIIFDLTNGNVSITTPHTPTEAYTVYVGNGWYRCVYTKTVDNSADTAFPAIGFGPTTSRPLDAFQPYYQGDGQSGVYVYGPQLIYGSEVYPYMETTSTPIGTVTENPFSVQSLSVTTTSAIVNITEEATLVPIIDNNTSTYTVYLTTVQYVTTTQTTTAEYTTVTPSTVLNWYTTADFLSSSQFLPLSTTQYGNLDNIITTACGINSAVDPNKYVIFASTGTDLIALTGDVNLNNVSVALSTNTTAIFSNIYFTGINKLLLNAATNHLYVLDKSTNLLHQFNASGFLTNDNVLANKLIYIKSIGGYGNYDSAQLFNAPESLAIYNSNLYVLDSGNSCIKQYDTDFNWITTHRLFRDFNGNYPIDLAADGSGNIYVLTNNMLIIKYSNDFSTKTVITLPNLFGAGEHYKSITTSVVDSDIFYLTTNMNVYKKFYSSIEDTVGVYLLNRFNVVPGEIIQSFTSFVNSINGSDTNLIFSRYNGAGKFGLYYDNINLNTVLVSDNFDVYPLSSIQISNNEYVQNWVFNKAIAKLIVNHTRLRDLIFSRFLYEPDDNGVLVYNGTRYMTPGEKQNVAFDQNMVNFIGCNEIFQNAIVNRALETIFNAQVSIFNMLQLDVQPAPDLNIPVYIN